MPDPAVIPIRRQTMNGMPVYWAETNLAFSAGALFRVGRCDETLPTAGITHLVEHLALPAASSTAAAFDGVVDGTQTHLWAGGARDDVLVLLKDAATALADLPLERLERERRILLTEASSRSFSSASQAAGLRWGAAGHGLPGFTELGLPVVTRDEVAGWARTRFTRGNAAFWMTAAPPAELDFPLPSGSRIDPPQPVPIPYVELPSAWGRGRPGWIAVSLLPHRSLDFTAALDAAEHRARDEIRYRAGMSYRVESRYFPITRHLAHVVLLADCLEENADRVRSSLLTTVFDLAGQGPTVEELERHSDEMAKHLAEPASVASRLAAHCCSELLGRPLESDEDLLRKLREVTPESAAQALADALQTALLLVPEEASLPGGRFKPYPPDPPRRIAGRRHRERGFRLRRKDEEVLVAGDDGVELIGPDYRVTVPFDECAALARWADGDRILWSLDGSSVEVVPERWRGGGEIVELIDARVPARLTMDMSAALYGGADFLRASELSESGNHEEAVALARAALERCPESAFGWLVLAACHAGLEQWSAALEAARHASALDPHDEQARRLVAYALWSTGDPDAAAEVAREALELGPGELESLADLAWLLAETDRAEEARRPAERAVELYPEAAEAWAALGCAAAARGERDEAEQALRKAIELDPKSAVHENRLGWRATLAQAAEADGHGMSTLYAEALLGALSGEPARAAAAATTALARNPADYRATDAMGLSAGANEAWDEAAQWFRRTLERRPLRCCSHIRLGIALASTGDSKGARDCLEKGRKLNPACEPYCSEKRRLREELAGPV